VRVIARDVIMELLSEPFDRIGLERVGRQEMRADPPAAEPYQPDLRRALRPFYQMRVPQQARPSRRGPSTRRYSRVPRALPPRAQPSGPGQPAHCAARQPQPARTDRMPGTARRTPALLRSRGGLKRHDRVFVHYGIMATSHVTGTTHTNRADASSKEILICLADAGPKSFGISVTVVREHGTTNLLGEDGTPTPA
jgi:hypothetical protein